MKRFRPPSIDAKPEVFVDFEFRDGCLFLVITNHGSRPAHSVSTSFDPSFSGLDGCRRIPLLNVFDDIGFLPPGKAIRTFVDGADSYFARGEPSVIRTEVSFQDGGGRTFNNQATHNLDIYRDLPHLPSDSPPEVQPNVGGGPRGDWGGHRRPPDVPTERPSGSASFELYEDRGGEYRWRLVHPNGNVIADSGEGYASKQKAEQGIASVRENASGADIEDQT